MKDNVAEIFFQSSLRKAIVSSSGVDRDTLSLTLSIQHFPLLTTASPTLLRAMKAGCGETVAERDVPEKCQLPPLDSRQKWFLRSRKGS